VLFAVAFAILARRAVRQGTSVESGAVWALVAAFLALGAGGGGLDSSAYLATGGLILVLSLIETAIDLTGGRISGADLRGAIALAGQMLTEDIELFPSAHETLTKLALPDSLREALSQGAAGQVTDHAAFL